ncbi:MAG: SCO family protein, partial [Gammaproteobacteria bacterium]
MRAPYLPGRREFVWFVLGACVASGIAALLWSRSEINATRIRAVLIEHPEFLADNPQTLDAARAVIQTRMLASRGAARARLLREKWQSFTHAAFTPSLGNRASSSVLIEFTDYTCVPCKTSAPAVRQALSDNPDLRVAIMLLPTGGAMAELAARVAVAAYRQNPEQFRVLHELLMEEKAPLTQAIILARAAAAGLDVEQIEREIGNIEHRRYLERVRLFATDLEVTGVPAFSMGEGLVLGGVSPTSLRKLIQSSSAVRSSPSRVPAIERPFTLLDEHGGLVSAQDFVGEWLLVFFGFTHCPDVCPTSMARLANAIHLLGPDAQHLRVAFITVDPERDIPEVMERYVASFGPHFIGLTGTKQQIADVVRTFGAYAAMQEPSKDGSYFVDHSSSFYLVEPGGRDRSRPDAAV